jgi:threonine/homoserine/homoserine lactone efflux protein
LGAIFLIYLGSKILFLKISKKVINDKTKIPETTIESIFLGLTTSLINPKILIFFTSIFSQFISQDYSIYTKFGMALLAGIIDSGWYILVAYSVSIKIVEKYIRARQKLIFYILGMILVIFSFYLFFKAIKFFI